MNRQQRMKNRATTRTLRPPCPECGLPGPHWVEIPFSLQDVADGLSASGFWTCSKFYGPDGRRLAP